jgi:eukaryotic-like serine/threonine-protein kinase
MRPASEAQKKAYAILEEALALTEAEREAFLSTRIAGDTALEHELRSLQRALDLSALDTRSIRAHSVAPTLDLAGTQVGHFRLLDEIGGGGMGVVYRGERTDGIQQRVAVKIVRQGLRDAMSRARFDLERASLAQLEHPGIARLIDAGITADQRPWYAMEFVEGEPIDAYCESRGLSVEARLDLLIDVCNAVEAAHRQLIVHRDIKPGNILVTAEGRAKLIDFGIAKHMSPATDTGLTRDTGTLFTSHYAAPEQVSGQEISTATDVFSLGALAYRLLTGERIFADSVRNDYEYLAAVTQRDIALPRSSATQRELASDLERILLKALARDPRQRYPSAAELAAEFVRFLKHLPIRARAPSVGYRFGKYLRRNRVSVALGLLLGVASVVGLATYVRQSQQVAAERDRATQAARRASFEARRTSQINQFLTQILQSADPRLGNREVTVAAALDQAIAKVDATLADDPDLAGEVLMTIASTDASMGRFDQAVQTAARAITYLRKVPARDVAIASAQADIGEWRELAGDPAAAEASLRPAVDVLRRLAPGSVELAEAERQLATVYTNTGRSEEAEKLFVSALSIQRKRGDPDLALARAVNDYAVLLGSTGRVAEALPLHREALAVAIAAQGADSPFVDDLRAGLAGALGFAGQIEESLSVFRDIFVRRARVLGATHLDTLWSKTAVANALVDLRQFAEAARLSSESYRDLLAAEGPTHQVTLFAQTILGRATCGLGEHRAALATLRDVANRRLQLYGPKHWLPANSRVLVARCMISAQQLGDAEQLLLPAIEVLESTQGPAFQRTQDAYADAVNLYTLRGDTRRAAEWRARQKPAG